MAPLWKAIGTFLGTLYFILHMLCTTPLSSFVQWKWSLTVQFFYLSNNCFQIFFYKHNQFLHLHDFCCSFVNDFISFKEIIILIACSRKDSQDFLKQFLPLYTSWYFSLFSNNSIVDLEKPDRICSPTFVADEFSELFLQSSILSIKHSTYA